MFQLESRDEVVVENGQWQGRVGRGKFQKRSTFSL
jgi:hypothetical protein